MGQHRAAGADNLWETGIEFGMYNNSRYHRSCPMPVNFSPFDGKFCALHGFH